MEVIALIEEALKHSVAIAISHLSVENVKPIFVRIQNAKTEELVFQAEIHKREHVIALKISPEIFANFCPVVMMSPAIMAVHAMVKPADVAKRMIYQNIMV